MKIISITNIFNFSGITLITIFSAFLGHEYLAAELGIVIGCSIFFSQILSSNSRNILIIKFTKENYIKRILIRIFSSLLIFVIINLFNYIYFKELNLIYISISIIVILQWINELYLLDLWQKNKQNKIKIYLFICILFYVLVFFNFLYGDLSNFKKLNISFVIFNLFFLKDVLLEINKIDLRILKKFLKEIFLIDFHNRALYSSSSIIFSNFLSRIIIFESLSPRLSGILFACFSIGSIPGSIFNSTFGPYLVKKKIKFFSFKIIIIFFLILLISFFLLLFRKKIIILYPNIIDFTLYALSFSLIGSMFMISALYYRQLLLFKKNLSIKKVFNIDILNSAIFIAIVLIISFKLDSIYFSIIFLVYAVNNFLIFRYHSKLSNIKKL